MDMGLIGRRTNDSHSERQMDGSFVVGREKAGVAGRTDGQHAEDGTCVSRLVSSP